MWLFLLSCLYSHWQPFWQPSSSIIHSVFIILLFYSIWERTNPNIKCICWWYYCCCRTVISNCCRHCFRRCCLCCQKEGLNCIIISRHIGYMVRAKWFYLTRPTWFLSDTPKKLNLIIMHWSSCILWLWLFSQEDCCQEAYGIFFYPVGSNWWRHLKYLDAMHILRNN